MTLEPGWGAAVDVGTGSVGFGVGGIVGELDGVEVGAGCVDVAVG